ncbi:glycoside hydrolase family 16 protein [Macrolepiota fuliginosa MF-IS2]|uniref:Glycoside hydrolase family 16 protein n=1 Tax=Macrolepiota fuliginosa MF-IS2 TaxID=1400762 RepID=A0A9P5XBB1_9AGAR|nr:glycoside hydrolase family 16 protein [Macrolepiota fuliginosa MF-IS2]
MTQSKRSLKTLITLIMVRTSLQARLAGNTTAACDTYIVNGIPGGFTQRVFADFSGVTAGGDAIALLSSYGLGVSDYSINSTPVPRTFVPSNVALGNGALNLKVSAFSGGSIQSAEMVTQDQFKYASVRTIQKSSTTPGVVEGNFFYLNDNQEIDWEILTSTISTASACVPAGIWATNQAVTPGTSNTHQTIPFTFDPTADFHEYRIDWSSDATAFYINGQQQTRFTTNVPTQAGSWIWNTWSSGDPCWSNGPPTADSITQIQSIEIFKGWTSTVSGTTCNV